MNALRISIKINATQLTKQKTEVYFNKFVNGWPDGKLGGRNKPPRGDQDVIGHQVDVAFGTLDFDQRLSLPSEQLLPSVNG